MAWIKHTDFYHYIKLYPVGQAEYSDVDIESRFQCRYVSMTNSGQTSIKNIYTEDFAEHDGLRVYTPTAAENNDIAYNLSEVTLKLRWRSDEVNRGDIQTLANDFYDYIKGRKLQYHDTFRPNNYLQLILKDAPKVVNEKLYGNVQYMFIEYKFTNFGGRVTSTPVI